MYLSLDEYYKKFEELTPPEGLDTFGRIKWYREERLKLQKLLSPEDLKIVLEREDHWCDKMQSSCG